VDNCPPDFGIIEGAAGQRRRAALQLAHPVLGSQFITKVLLRISIMILLFDFWYHFGWLLRIENDLCLDFI
jgi:hypothetical protein